MKSRKYLLLLTLLLPLVSYSCKDEITTPNDPPGRRDYVWSVDTISNGRPWNEYYKLWGTSPSDLWCIGTNGDFNKMILHYDGKTWTNYKYPGQAIEPWSIFGFNNNEFWVGGGSGLIFRYKDSNFSQFGPNYGLDGYSNLVFESLCGNTSEDIYAAGCAYKTTDHKLYGILMHYDGTEWKYVNKPEIETQFIEMKKGKNDSPNYYIMGYTDTDNKWSFYEFNGSTIKRIYSSKEDLGLCSIDNKIYFGIDKKLFEYHLNTFINIKDFSNTNIISTKLFSGRSENDLFLHMQDGIGHDNGQDVKTLFHLNPGVVFSGIALFEKDAFFLCPDFSTHTFIVVHGKLK